MLKNNVYDKAYIFALKIVKTYQQVSSEKKEFVLSKQLLRSGTSIGANIAEANGAISRPEFSAKMSIAYKESLETQYWLSLLKDAQFIGICDFDSLSQNAEELSKILYTIIRKSRQKPI